MRIKSNRNGLTFFSAKGLWVAILPFSSFFYFYYIFIFDSSRARLRVTLGFRLWMTLWSTLCLLFNDLIKLYLHNFYATFSIQMLYRYFSTLYV